MNDHGPPGMWIRGSFYPRKSTTLLPPPETEHKVACACYWNIIILWLALGGSIYALRVMNNDRAAQIQILTHRIEILESQSK